MPPDPGEKCGLAELGLGEAQITDLRAAGIAGEGE